MRLGPREGLFDYAILSRQQQVNLDPKEGLIRFHEVLDLSKRCAGTGSGDHGCGPSHFWKSHCGSLGGRLSGIAQTESKAAPKAGGAGGKCQTLVKRRRAYSCQVVLVNGINDRVTNTFAA